MGVVSLRYRKACRYVREVRKIDFISSSLKPYRKCSLVTKGRFSKLGIEKCFQKYIHKKRVNLRNYFRLLHLDVQKNVNKEKMRRITALMSIYTIMVDYTGQKVKLHLIRKAHGTIVNRTSEKKNALYRNCLKIVDAVSTIIATKNQPFHR